MMDREKSDCQDSRTFMPAWDKDQPNQQIHICHEPVRKYSSKQFMNYHLEKREISQKDPKQGCVYLFFFPHQSRRRFFKIGHTKSFLFHGEHLSDDYGQLICFSAKINSKDCQLLQHYTLQYFHHYRILRQLYSWNSGYCYQKERKKWFDFSLIPSMEYVVDVIYELSRYSRYDQNRQMVSPVATVYQKMREKYPEVNIQCSYLETRLRIDKPKDLDPEVLKLQKKKRNRECYKINQQLCTKKCKQFYGSEHSIKNADDFIPNLKKETFQEKLNFETNNFMRQEPRYFNLQPQPVTLDRQPQWRMTQNIQKYSQSIYPYENLRNKEEILEKKGKKAGWIYIFYDPHENNKRLFKIGQTQHFERRAHEHVDQLGKILIFVGKVWSNDCQLHEEYIFDYFFNYRVVRERYHYLKNKYLPAVQWFYFPDLTIQYVIDVIYQICCYENRNPRVSPITTVWHEMQVHYEDTGINMNFNTQYYKPTLRDDKKEVSPELKQKDKRKNLLDCYKINQDLFQYKMGQFLCSDLEEKQIQSADDLIPDLRKQKYQEWRKQFDRYWLESELKKKEDSQLKQIQQKFRTFEHTTIKVKKSKKRKMDLQSDEQSIDSESEPINSESQLIYSESQSLNSDSESMEEQSEIFSQTIKHKMDIDHEIQQEFESKQRKTLIKSSKKKIIKENKYIKKSAVQIKKTLRRIQENRYADSEEEMEIKRYDVMISKKNRRKMEIESDDPEGEKQNEEIIQHPQSQSMRHCDEGTEQKTLIKQEKRKMDISSD